MSEYAHTVENFCRETSTEKFDTHDNFDLRYPTNFHTCILNLWSLYWKMYVSLSLLVPGLVHYRGGGGGGSLH